MQVRLSEDLHQEWVIKSGVDPRIVKENVEEITGREGAKRIRQLKKSKLLADGWWVPSIHPRLNTSSGYGQFKPSTPYRDDKGERKYLNPQGMKTEAMFLLMPETDYWEKVFQDLSIVVTITEGLKKAGCLLSNGRATVALPGVWNGTVSLSKENSIFDVIDSLKELAVPGRQFNLAFDADLMTKPQVKMALFRLGNTLQERGCLVKIVLWDLKHGKGADDLIVQRGIDAYDKAESEALDFDKWKTQSIPTVGKTNGNSMKAKIYRMLQDLSEFFEIDEFSLDYRYNGELLDVPWLEAYLSDMVDGDAPKGYIISVLHEIARERPYSDVREYLQQCSTLSDYGGSIKWLADVMGLETDIERTLLKRWLISAVARAMKPGCQADSVLIQQGVEGLGKTTLMETLAGGSSRFYSTTADPSNKDFRQLTVGLWICELGEIENTLKRDIGALKMYITQRDDKFRVPYGSKVDTFPRHFIFCGSTNVDEPINDPDGERRWWVVKVTKQIPIPEVVKRRSLIWAEAMALYNLGEQWHLTEEERIVYKKFASAFRTDAGYREWIEYNILRPDGQYHHFLTQPFTTRDLNIAFGRLEFVGPKSKGEEMALASDLKKAGFVKDHQAVWDARSKTTSRFWRFMQK